MHFQSQKNEWIKQKYFKMRYDEIRVPNGSLVQVYCDMEGTNCGGQGGWMRVAHVNMSQDGVSCPQGLTQKTMSGLDVL